MDVNISGRRLCPLPQRFAGTRSVLVAVKRWLVGCGYKMGIRGCGAFSMGKRSWLGLTRLPPGQCSALIAWSTPVPPGGPVATLVTIATFSGARMPGTLTHTCCCLPSPHGHPRLKVRALG